jgi:hypothetical protein
MSAVDTPPAEETVEDYLVPKEPPKPDRPLIVGDIIYLSVNRNDFDGYICSEGCIPCFLRSPSPFFIIIHTSLPLCVHAAFLGFVDNRITIQWFAEGSGNLPENFSQSLFRVVPKRSYKAQSQTKKLEKKV